MRSTPFAGVLFVLAKLRVETLKINGVQKQFPTGIPQTLTELLKNLDINEATVAAEIDGKIIEKQNFAQTQLSNAQVVELIRFAGGG
jgi:thiamine biosynthesis protein ThiS